MEKQDNNMLENLLWWINYEGIILISWYACIIFISVRIISKRTIIQIVLCMKGIFSALVGISSTYWN